VTIGIVAKIVGTGDFVSVSDRMISWGDQIPAVDNATLKDLILGKRWAVLYSGNDICPVLPIVDKARELLKAKGKETLENVQSSLCEAYSVKVRDAVTKKFLSRYGLTSVEQFRESGPIWTPSVCQNFKKN
jgi:hypothetical protein